MDTPKILSGYSDLEKGAYLGAIASLATADRQASQEEIGYLSKLCDAAELSQQQKDYVLRAATEISGAELDQCLDVLKNSELRYSLVTDLIAFAESDNSYSEAELKIVNKISHYLGVSDKQFSLLHRYTGKASEPQPMPVEPISPSFLFSTGLQEKMQHAGIHTASLLKGLLGMAGSLILGNVLSRGMGQDIRQDGGGLGSLIGMLSGGRGFGSTGGLLGRMLAGNRGW